MKTVRRVVFWLHLVTGVSAGVVVLIMSVTGVLLTYEKQIIRWADTRTYREAPPASDAQRLPIDRLIQAVSASNGGAAATTVTVWADRSAPAAVAIGTHPIYVNPYTGVVLGEGSDRTRAFFRRMTDWHRWLGVAVGPGRVTARAITGACNLAFLFLVLSGFVAAENLDVAPDPKRRVVQGGSPRKGARLQLAQRYRLLVRRSARHRRVQRRRHLVSVGGQSRVPDCG